ncbi:MAG TPA: hypothetical protein VHV08_17555 [Pirellulales bacterium]|nr:hypothetical protein [Pirellulales bacterium]
MATPDSAQPQPTWSSDTRSWVSLLLVVHLFAVFVAVTTYTRPSGSQTLLHDLFGPYLRNLHLTPYPASYPFARFHLTLGTPGDFDFLCQVEYVDSAGDTGVVTLPDLAMQPGIRFRRYQSLINAAGSLAADEEEDVSSALFRAIAGSILQAHGASQGVVRCRTREIPQLAALATLDSVPQELAIKERDVYEARVFVTPDGVELLKQSTKLETAPIERAKPSGAAQP